MSNFYLLSIKHVSGEVRPIFQNY